MILPRSVCRMDYDGTMRYQGLDAARRYYTFNALLLQENRLSACLSLLSQGE